MILLITTADPGDGEKQNKTKRENLLKGVISDFT